VNRTGTRELAVRCRDEVVAGDVENALARLRPVVASRTPFPLLDMAGQSIAGAAATNAAGFTALLDGLAATDEIGAWPLIGSALAAAYLPHDPPRAFAQARRYILQAGVWHATDARQVLPRPARTLAAGADGEQEATQTDGAQSGHLPAG